MSAQGQMVRVDQLRRGHIVDLEGDPYADPDQESSDYEYEYVVVEKLQPETAGCTCVHFLLSASVGFPPDHEVLVVGQHQDMEAE